jgi:hypothetical protein
VLYPAYLSDTLLRPAEAGAYRPLWSADVLGELRRNLIERGIDADKVDHRLAEMRHAFPSAMVTGYEALVDVMANHPKDRHVWRTPTSSCWINLIFIQGSLWTYSINRQPPTAASQPRSPACW